jgi:hypothetical protein
VSAASADPTGVNGDQGQDEQVQQHEDRYSSSRFGHSTQIQSSRNQCQQVQASIKIVQRYVGKALATLLLLEPSKLEMLDALWPSKLCHYIQNQQLCVYFYKSAIALMLLPAYRWVDAMDRNAATISHHTDIGTSEVHFYSGWRKIKTKRARFPHGKTYKKNDANRQRCSKATPASYCKGCDGTTEKLRLIESIYCC